MKRISCKNCHTSFVGKFCNNCGQNANVGSLTMHDIVHETWHAMTHTDSGILKLLKDLLMRPKSVYLNYFSGQRKTYFSPVTFFLITAAILLILGVKVFDYEDYRLKTFNEFGRYALMVTKFKTLLLLPIEVLATWSLFHKQYNLAKHIVFWLYLNGFLFAIKIVLIPIYFPFIAHKSFIDDAIQIIQSLVMLIHLILVFRNKKWFNMILILLLANFIFVCNYILTAYLLFENNLFVQTRTSNLFELIIKAYQP